jgi:PAS domain S-box-containing protein
MSFESSQRPTVRATIRNVPLISWFLLVLIGIVTAGVYYAQMKFWRLSLESNETEVVDIVIERIGDDFEPALADLLILSEAPKLQAYIEHSGEAERAALGDMFLRLSRVKSDYFKMRFLDENGVEVVRVNNNHGSPYIVPLEELQIKSSRYFFTETFKLAKGQIFITPFDLNVDEGKIEQPPHPTIRFCIPVFDRQDRKRGVLLINYEGRKILRRFEDETARSAGHVVLLNSEGYWLKGIKPEDEWGFMTPAGKEKTFGKAFPAAWSRISGNESGTFYNQDGFFAFHTMYPMAEVQRFVLDRVKGDPFPLGRIESYQWKIVSFVPEAVLQAKSRGNLSRLALVDSLFLVILVVGSWVAANARVNGRRAAASLKRQAELLDLAHDAIIVWDMSQTILFWNRGAEGLYGWPREEAIGKNVSALLHSRCPQLIHDVQDKLLLQGQWSGDVIASRRDGTEVTTFVRCALQKDQRGNPHVILAIATDISERKRAEQDLHKAKEAAEAASRAKSEFLANMSHEIRTPMNGIIGMTELVLDTELNPEQRECLGMAKTSADSLLAVINDILDFSRIEAGKLEFDEIEFDVRDCLGDTIKMLSLRAHQKALELACHIRQDVPHVLRGDPGRLRQIVVNLVGNAIKFTEQGEVVVQVEKESLTEDEVCLRFAISDTGIGITPDKQKTIFEAFTQVDSSMARKYSGTGLGLTISSRLVERMGGRIWVKSELGKGSKFHFTARLGVSKAADLQPAPKKTGDLRGVSVLVVDDNATNRRILTEMVAHWYMRPTAVDGGCVALSALEQARQASDPFPLIIVDAQMPEMDGFTLIERIQQRPELAGATIMMLTSAGQAGDAARCRRLGVAAYLTKPIKQSELLEAILVALGAAARKQAQAPLVTQHSLRESRQRLRILVAEDNAVNQALAARLLEKRGHTVAVAANGREVLAALEKETFDLVLMDVQMPEMDGFGATAAIRAKEIGSATHIPIVAITAHAMRGDRERCLAAGMDAYLSKPIRANELFEMIEDLTHCAAPPRSAAPRGKDTDPVLAHAERGDKSL